METDLIFFHFNSKSTQERVIDGKREEQWTIFFSEKHFSEMDDAFNLL